jgi:hypothetical protein
MDIFIQPARSIILGGMECDHCLLPSIRPDIHPYTQTIGDSEQANIL